MTRLQRLLCLALGLLTAATVAAATLIHTRAEAGRKALAEADRAHVRWFATRMDEMVTEASVRDLLSRQTDLQKATVRTNRRLLAALERARNARRPVIHAQPRVVYRVRTVFVSSGAR